jgi:hypothetical protein
VAAPGQFDVQIVDQRAEPGEEQQRQLEALSQRNPLGRFDNLVYVLERQPG